MCLDPVWMHICVKYEGSVIHYTGSRGNYCEKDKWLPFKNLAHILPSLVSVGTPM